jgi:radical SAM/Cys-rich protein
LQVTLAQNFAQALKDSRISTRSKRLTTLQMNITKLCNQVCRHCHVDASPRRKESMSDETIAACLSVLRRYPQIDTVDITGGAPELHPGFRDFVRAAKKIDKRVIVRHNLTVTIDPHPLSKISLADLPDFFAINRVELVSSLPCYKEANTDNQRGSGVFRKSLDSLRMLNRAGFGVEGSGLILNLAYNPVGAVLPPDQYQLEIDYKSYLAEEYGIHFNRLLVMTNVPIHRFRADLVQQKALESYVDLLKQSFNPRAALGIMCKNLISVSYDGKLFDCDFNQMLGSEVTTTHSRTIFDFDLALLEGRSISFGDHCFACTAGAGSSCSGTTVR